MKKLGLFAASLLLLSQPVHADELEDQLVPYLDTIYGDLVKQSKKAVDSCEAFEKTLASKDSAKAINDSFANLVLDWKRVQSLYVIGEYDNEAIDLPHYIDVYHRGKENLNEQMQRIIDANDDAEQALFKHSFKTVNALEYTLFSTKTISPRQIALSKVITHNLCQRLETIHHEYTTHKADFLEQPKKAVAVLLNELIDSNYKLKEWRLGDAAGLSRKRRGEPNEKFAEYRLSQLSLPAARAIMEAHQWLTDKDSEFAKIISILAQHDEIDEPVQALADANTHTQHIVSLLKPLTDDAITDSAAIKPIYKSLDNLYDSYFTELIESLSDIVARILDSDGD